MPAPDDPTIPTDVRERLRTAERLMGSTDANQWGAAVAQVDEAIRDLDRLVATSTAPGPRRMLAGAWSLRVRALERIGTPRALDDAITAQGNAIAHRRQLAAASDALDDRGEAALAWQHEGNLRQRRGRPEDLRTAINSYDEAIAALRDLSEDGRPALRQLLGVTWLNRGSTWVRIDEPAAPAEALRSLDQAIALLSSLARENAAANQIALAAAWMNRAHVVLRYPSGTDGATQAREACAETIRLVAATEHEHPGAADLGMKARHILCRAIGTRLAATVPPAAAEQAELFAAATDAVDDGLALARHWQQQGAALPLPFVADLFRFGAQTYLSRQPHFLAEFVLENLDPGSSGHPLPPHPELHAIARDAVALALQELERPQLLQVDAPQTDRRIQALHDLRDAAVRLENLHPPSPDKPPEPG
jgi:hypothetical protein